MLCEKSVKIYFKEGQDGDKIECIGKVGKTVLDVAIDHDIDIEGACGGELACSTCHVIVDKNDSTIKNPTKFIGKSYSKDEALKLSKEFGWSIKEQEPDIWRRVVASPKPLYIFNGNSVKHLVDFGTIVVAGGGGGLSPSSSGGG